ncbi:MAG TPA: hypothetical protein VMD47_02510 [Candidatus Acidoferrales bacterium]|nr:hypothetical protein [Candidatus Acidoferrales bacterium]
MWMLLCSQPLYSNEQEQSDGTMLVQVPGSGVKIDRVDFYEYYAEQQSYAKLTNHPSWGTECIAFTNTSTRPIALVYFDVSWVSKDGTSEVDEPVVPEGYYGDPLMPGVTIGLTTSGKNSGKAFGYCRGTDHGSQLSQDARAEVFVTSVLYQDGAAWHLVPAIEGSVIGAPGAPITLTAAQTYWYTFPTTLSKYGVDGVAGPSECAKFRNNSTKATADVFVLFRHLDADGVDLGDDKLEVKVPVEPGATRTACRTFFAPMDPWKRGDAEQAAKGAGPAPRVVYYEGKPSTLSAQITEADFADGTSWKLAPSSL